MIHFKRIVFLAAVGAFLGHFGAMLRVPVGILILLATVFGLYVDKIIRR